MGRLEELRELRQLQQEDRGAVNGKASPTPTLDEFLERVTFADGSERVPADFKVERGLGGFQATFFEHMEGWKLIVQCRRSDAVLAALELALCDLDYPRQPFATWKPLPKWWKELQKKTGQKP